MNQHTPLNAGNTANLAGDVISLMHDILSWQPQIERAIRNLEGMYSFNDVVAMVLRQQVQFYNFDRCCLFMQLEKYPGYSIYHCFIACGEFEGLLEIEPAITEVAKELGCRYLSLAGRTGWPRKLKDHGWKHRLSVMHKEIS